MRLINVHTLEFREFFDKFIPPYGILSHTWGPIEDELSYHDFLSNQKRHTSGFRKVQGCCEFVKNRKVFNFDKLRQIRPTAFSEEDRRMRSGQSETLNWLWIDTICIDHRSSADVSEAINSMYAWYGYAEECYVYLSNVSSTSGARHSDIISALWSSRWFRRGWTLQELLAPRAKLFCSSTWDVIGYMHDVQRPLSYSESQTTELSSSTLPELSGLVSEITKIELKYLNGSATVTSASIATRMTWAAARETLRVEDAAYCLFGIFDVNMALLYGEGRKAFIRLQEKIVARSGDQSIFFWSHVPDENPDKVPAPQRRSVGMLAPHAGCFTSLANPLDRPEHPYPVTNLGMKLRTRSRRVRFIGRMDTNCCLHVVELDCKDYQSNLTLEVALLECNHTALPEFYRSRCNDEPTPHDLHRKFPEGKREAAKPIKAFVKTSIPQSSQCESCRAFDDVVVEHLRLSLSTNISEASQFWSF